MYRTRTAPSILNATLLLLFFISPVFPQPRVSSNQKPATDPPPAPLAFKEFFEPSVSSLTPSAKLEALNNHQVKLIGFMAQMEDEREGSFYLVPRPVFGDEEGGGTADLPPEAVLVIVPFRSHQKISFVPGLLEVTGVLELSAKEVDGQVSRIRLIMDQPEKQFSRSKD